MTQAYSPNAVGSVVPLWTGRGPGGGGGGGAAAVFRLAFTDADLVAGQLTVLHGLGADFNTLDIYDNNALRLGDADQVANIDPNTLSVDFSTIQAALGGVIPGVWNIVIVGG